MPLAKPQLFHAIADPASARARSYAVDHDLLERVQFRNTSYPEVVVDLQVHGGGPLPAIWDGATLHAGEAAVLAFLQAL